MVFFRVDKNKPFRGPHQEARIYDQGAPLSRARAAMVMVHGRGATAQGILQLVPEFAQPDFYYAAPQAHSNTWYPWSFLEPQEKNEPGISSGLQLLDDLLKSVTAEGIPPEKVFLLGFSQGACLASEYLARHPQRIGGLVILSGGLIGPSVSVEHYSGSVEDTPVFIGCSDFDSHIPQSRVDETEAVFEKLGGRVNKKIYEGMGHRIIEDEIRVIRGMMAHVLNGE